MTEVDTSRAPKGEFAARRLIDAVVASDDRVERHFLEVKSTLDLTTKRDQAKLAKFILGAANRMPDQASKAFEGYGVMVVGASQGSAAGIPPVEALEIQKAVLPFIGSDGPPYDLVRVPVAGSDTEVLVLLVDPPEWGHGPFICQKSGDSQLRDGAVFVRADGETREARADELNQLILRGHVVTAQVDFGVRVLGVVRPIEIDDARTVDEFLSLERTRLLAALEDSKRPPGSNEALDDPITRAIGPSIAAVSRHAQSALRSVTEAESRSEDDYLASVVEWEQRVRAAWPAAVLRLVGALAQPVEIEVTNREKTFFHDVELKVHIEGDVTGAECWEPGDDLCRQDVDIPDPPRAWGPKTSRLFDLGPSRGSHQHMLLPPITASTFPRTSWTNSGSVDWAFSVGQLRPKEVDTSDDGQLVLYTRDPSMTSVQGAWEITARDHHDVFSGSLDVEVGEPIDLTHAFRLILGLEEHG